MSLYGFGCRLSLRSLFLSGFLFFITVLAVLSTGGVIDFSRNPNPEVFGVADWKRASEYIFSNAQPGNSIIFHSPFCRVPYDYFLRRDSASVLSPTVIHPADRIDAQFPIEAEITQSREGPSNDELEALSSRYDRVWLVLGLTGSPHWRRMRSVLSRQFTLVSDRAFLGFIYWREPSVRPEVFVQPYPDRVGVRVLLYGKSDEPQVGYYQQPGLQARSGLAGAR